jgi:endoglucanase
MTHRRAFVVSLLALAAAPLAAQDRTIELLRQLADAPGPPGFEEPIRKVMVDQMKPFASAITYDGLGSIIATQGTQGPRIMVDAHGRARRRVRRVTPRGC